VDPIIIIVWLIYHNDYGIIIFVITWYKFKKKGRKVAGADNIFV